MARDIQIAVRLTADEAEQIKAAADRESRTASGLVRLIVLEWLKRKA